MNMRSITPAFCLPILAAALAGASFVQSALAQQERGPRRGMERAQSPRAEQVGGPRFGQQFGQQFFMPGRFQHLLEPDYHMRDGALMQQELGLDRNQRMIVELFLEDYRAAFDEAAEPLRDAIRRVRRPAGMFPGGGWARGDGPGDVIRLEAGDRQEIELIGESIRAALQRRAEAGGAGGAGEDGEGPRPFIMVQRIESDGETTVNISIDGADVPEEVRERAERIARRIEERIAQRREEFERRQREAAERGEDEPEPLEPEEVISIAQQFLTKKESLRLQFEQDVEAMLGPDQREFWPQAKALIRRVSRLQLGRLSGEQIDLAAVVRDLNMPSFVFERLEPHLAMYAAELDAALEARTLALDRADIDLFEAIHAQDWDGMLKIDEKIAARRIAVRDVNERHAEHIAAVIEPEDWRARFADEVRARTYPWIARPTPFSRMANAALNSEGLTDEQREALEDLMARYEAEVALADESAIAQIRESEHLRTRQFIEMMQQLQSGERPGPGMRGMMGQFNSMQERMTVAMRYMREMRSVLPAELLPEGGRFVPFEFE